MPKKVNDCNQERNIVINKLFDLLNINENNNKFSLHHLDNNTELQENILSLEPKIKKVFICGTWSCFKNNDFKRKPLSIIKCIMKDIGYNVLSIRKKTNGVRDTEYHIVKDLINFDFQKSVK